MKIKAVYLFLAGFLSLPVIICGQSPVLTIKDAITGFEKAILAKDTALLSGVIADNFSVSTTTWPASGRLLQSVFNRPQTIEYIRLVSDNQTSVDEKKQKVTVQIKESGKDPIETDVFFNKDNQILYVDYIDQLFGRNRYQESNLQARIPFSTTETGSIIITLRLNDQSRSLRFLFDSGADGMAISQELADSLNLKITNDQETSIVGGKMNIKISGGNTVILDTLKLGNQSIAVFEKMREGIDGLIGLNLAKQFIMKFDFDKKKLSLYNFGAYQYEKEGETIPITVPNNIPIIPAFIDLTGTGYINGNFAFDTGASYYLLAFSPFVRKNKLLTSGFSPESQTTTVSMGKATPTFNGKCKDFQLDHIHFKDMPVSLQAGSNWNPGADGSLGIQFSSRYNFTINLLEKEIHLTPNNFIPES